jgi:cytochrome P450
MSTTKPGAPDLDLRSRANLHDPYAAHRWLRDNDPVHWSEGLQGWIVSRYGDVLEVFNRTPRFSAERFRKLAQRFRSERPEVRAVAEVLSDWLVFRDPPDHTRLRELLQKTFTPRHLEKNRDGIQITVDTLLDRVVERGEMDFMRDFAFPLPAIVIAILLGAPKEDIESIKLWSDRLAAHVGGAVGELDNFSEAKAGADALVDYFRTLLAERRRRPGDDLMSLLLRAEHEGERLSGEEVVSNCVLLLFAGHETTTNLLGNGLFHLLHDPEQQRELRAHPEWMELAVEEFLRIECPVAATIKVATEDFSWHGAHIQRGERLIPFMASANRDPRRFEHPDRLDIARHPNRHLAFGYGIHFCLGAPLARLEAQLAFTTLLRRFPRLGLVAPEPRWKPQIFMRGPEALPVHWPT